MSEHVELHLGDVVSIGGDACLIYSDEYGQWCNVILYSGMMGGITGRTDLQKSCDGPPLFNISEIVEELRH